jgi:hypothetical protein
MVSLSNCPHPTPFLRNSAAEIYILTFSGFCGSAGFVVFFVEGPVLRNFAVALRRLFHEEAVHHGYGEKRSSSERMKRNESRHWNTEENT